MMPARNAILAVRMIKPEGTSVPTGRCAAAPGWKVFQLTYVFMLVGFWMTFVNVAGVIRFGVPLRWVGLAACLVAAAQLPRVARGARAFVVFVAIYTLVALASAAASPDTTLSLAKWFPLMLELVLACYFLPTRLSRAEWQWCFDALSWVTLLMVLGTAVGLTGGGASPGQRFRGGLDTNPNTVGTICLASVALWVWRLRDADRNGRRGWRLLAAPAVALSLLSLALTGSRSSAGGTVAALGVWAAASMRRSTGRKGLFVALIVAAALVYASSGFLAPALQVFFRTGPSGVLSTRLGQWEVCLNDLKQNPFLGTGFGVSSQAEGMVVGLSSVGSLVDGGGYFSVLASLGLIGTAAFGAVLLSLYLRAAALVLRPYGHPAYALQAGAMVVALSVNLIGEPWAVAPGNPVHLIFWLAGGAMSCAHAPNADRRGRGPMLLRGGADV